MAPFLLERAVMIQKLSPCKINLLLNILGKREDGFHALETILMPVPLNDELYFETTSQGGIKLTIEGADLSPGRDNLIIRAAESFCDHAKTTQHVSIHLKKNIPMEAGLGGGSSNAAITLLAMNELSGLPLESETLVKIAASLGSDVPFFLQSNPSLGTGRGEKITSLPPFKALKGKALFLVKPDFGISTGWAYTNLKRFPKLLNGQPGRGTELVKALESSELNQAAPLFFNSLEGPVLEKFPILQLFQNTLSDLGAEVTLMSGSGSTTFGIFPDLDEARSAKEGFCRDFGMNHWIHTTTLDG